MLRRHTIARHERGFLFAGAWRSPSAAVPSGSESVVVVQATASAVNESERGYGRSVTARIGGWLKELGLRFGGACFIFDA